MPILTTEQAIKHCRADPDADAVMVELYLGAAIDAAFEGGQQVALLLSQRLIGRKKWIAK